MRFSGHAHLLLFFITVSTFAQNKSHDPIATSGAEELAPPQGSCDELREVLYSPRARNYLKKTEQFATKLGLNCWIGAKLPAQDSLLGQIEESMHRSLFKLDPSLTFEGTKFLATSPCVRSFSEYYYAQQADPESLNTTLEDALNALSVRVSQDPLMPLALDFIESMSPLSEDRARKTLDQ